MILNLRLNEHKHAREEFQFLFHFKQYIRFNLRNKMNPVIRTHRSTYQVRKPAFKITPQNQFMPIVLKKIASHSLLMCFQKIKQSFLKDLHRVNNLQRIYQRHLKTAFFLILQKSLNTQKTKTLKEKCQILSFNILNKFYINIVKKGFTKIKDSQANFFQKEQAAKLIFNQFQSLYHQKQLKTGIQQIKKLNVKFEKRKEGFDKLNIRFKELQSKKVKSFFIFLIKQIFQKYYAYLFKVSQEKRKKAYDLQNQKKARLSLEKVNLTKFKNEVDNSRKNQNLYSLKKEANVKLAQTKGNIKNDEQILQNKKNDNQMLKEMIEGLKDVHKNRKWLKDQSKKDRGAYERVTKLYQRTSSEDDAEKDKLKMVKEKLKNHMNFNVLKGLSQFFAQKNLRNNKLICLYQKTPVEILHISKQYIRVHEENLLLKQFIQILIELELKKDKDKQLNKSFKELEKQFDALVAQSSKDSIKPIPKSPKSAMRSGFRPLN